MQLLVTGGAGFIGSNFVRLVLRETEHDVTTLDALTYAGSLDNLSGVLDHPDHEFVEGDIRDEELVSELVSDADAVLNFAAESHVDRSIEGAGPFVETNVRGTQVLLDAALDADVDQFLQVSTDEVYGEIVDGVFEEGDSLNPRNPYAATKASADLLAKSYHSTHDLQVIITRSSNNYGPRQHEEKLIPKFITRAADEKSLPLYGDGTNVREWVYVEDNCQAILTALEKGESGEVYNIGSGEELENQKVAEQIVEELGVSIELIEFVEDRPGHDQRYALDTTKIQSLGWEPTTSFEDGLEQTVEYYLE